MRKLREACNETKKKEEKAITLIALVITIIVLLILAGVTIATLTGENGILTRATNSKEASGQAEVEEKVKIAVNGLQAKNLGDTSKITPKAIAEEVNKNDGRDDVYAENETTFPTNIIFPKENRKVGITVDFKIGEVEEESNSIYSIDIDESQIAPQDLFDYEVIENETSKVSFVGELDSLPVKEARITRIKPEYCNGAGYNPDTNENDLSDTNYEIKYEGITDTLIIPYQVEIEGELYKVTEVNLTIEGRAGGAVGIGSPNIENIIFPNTINKIKMGGNGAHTNTILKRVVLSENIEKLPEGTFYQCINLININIPRSITIIENGVFRQCYSLNSIEIPNSVTSIGYDAFQYCSSLSSIEIPNSVTSIGYGAFSYCKSLTSIEIPNSVTSIEDNAFQYCSSLSSIEIPDSVTSIGYGAFDSCSSLTSIEIPNSVTSIEDYAFYKCDSLKTINIQKSEGSISGAPWGADTSTVINWLG